MFCPNCGKEIENGSAFCNHCGEKMKNYETTDYDISSRSDNFGDEDPFVDDETLFLEENEETSDEGTIYTNEPPRSPYDTVPPPIVAAPVQLRETYTPPPEVPAAVPPARQPVSRQPQYDDEYVERRSGTSPWMAAALSAVTVLLLVACFVLFIKPGYIVNDGKESDTEKTSSRSKTKSKPESDEDTEDTDTVIFELSSDSDPENESEYESSKAVSSKLTSSKYVSSKEISSKEESSKAASSKATSSKSTSSKAASSKAASSKAASSKAASSKAASSKAASSKAASSKAASSKAASSKAASSKAASSKAASSSETSSKYESSEVSSYQPETDSDIVSSEPQSTDSDVYSDEDKAILEEAIGFTTSERPEFSEFEWCYGQSGMIVTPPDGADVITNPLGYFGGWKAMVIYNAGSSEQYIRELDNISIGIYNGTADVTIDWYLMETEGSELDNEEGMADTLLVGKTSSEGIYCDNDEMYITLVHLWKANGKEYALGQIGRKDGVPAYIALVRP